VTDLPDHDSLLARRFAALATPDAGDWLEVHRRARRARVRKAALLVAAAIAAILVAAPAVGLPRVVVDWVGAEPAPKDTQVLFQQLVGGEGAPPGLDPRVIPNAARKVTTMEHEGREHVLWVAPTARGGFCFLWIHGSGGCVADRALPQVPTRPGERNPLLLGTNWRGNGEVWTEIDGALLLPETDRLTLEYVDGSESDIPFVWVTAPIDAGFYRYWIPPEHRELGHELAAIVARDHDGRVLARRLSPHVAT
jgi:hypothetical protein